MTGTSQKLMMVWAWGVIVFGAVLMGGAFAAFDTPAQTLMVLLSGNTSAMDNPLRFAVGLMGAVTFGWGLTVLAVASVSHLLNLHVAQALWGRLTGAVAAWYIVDCTISVATGFGLNAVSNTVLLVTFLLITWRASLIGNPISKRDSKAWSSH